MRSNLMSCPCQLERSQPHTLRIPFNSSVANHISTACKHSSNTSWITNWELKSMYIWSNVSKSGCTLSQHTHINVSSSTLITLNTIDEKTEDNNQYRIRPKRHQKNTRGLWTALNISLKRFKSPPLIPVNSTRRLNCRCPVDWYHIPFVLVPLHWSHRAFLIRQFIADLICSYRSDSRNYPADAHVKSAERHEWPHPEERAIGSAVADLDSKSAP